MDHIGSTKESSHLVEELPEHARPFLDHGHDHPGGDRGPIGVGQQFGHPSDGDVLAGHQVTDVSPQCGPVASGGRRLAGERPRGLCSAGTALALCLVLRAEKGHWWQIEHLTGDDRRDWCVGQVIAAALTRIRSVDLSGVRSRTLCEVASRVAGLPTLLLA